MNSNPTLKTLNMTKLSERFALREKLVKLGFTPNCLFCERPLPYHHPDCVDWKVVVYGR